jgi:hypothetical protein
MKILATAFLFSLLLTSGFAQVTLAPKDLDNLVALGELYTRNNMAKGEAFARSADSLRTPTLNRVVDLLLAPGQAGPALLDKRFLYRPSQQDLYLWYVIREIHYNHVSKAQKPRPARVVATEVLGQTIDSRFLLDNYYYRFGSGLGFLFNTEDLSGYNFNLDSLGLQNETEKAIFYFNMLNALATGRFRVLQVMKKDDKIIYFAGRLPKFNGQEYYRYKHFDYPDFKWVGYEEKEWYNKRHLGGCTTCCLFTCRRPRPCRARRPRKPSTINPSCTSRAISAIARTAGAAEAVRAVRALSRGGAETTWHLDF